MAREADHPDIVAKVLATELRADPPFIMTVVGGFTPRDTACNAGGLLDPKDALSCLFRRGTPSRTRLLSPLGRRGPHPIHFYFYSLRPTPTDTPQRLYDQTVPRNAVIGRLYNQTINQMSHAVIHGTSNSTLLALRRRF